MGFFATLAQAITRFGLIAAEAHVIEHAALEAGGKVFIERAKAAIGTYEYGWIELDPATIARKQHGDTPLLDTGEIRDSGGYEVHGNRLIAGFTDEKIVYHEYGTRHHPPRPVVGGTVEYHGHEIARIVGVGFAEIAVASLFTGSAVSAIGHVLAHHR